MKGVSPKTFRGTGQGTSGRAMASPRSLGAGYILGKNPLVEWKILKLYTVLMWLDLILMIYDQNSYIYIMIKTCILCIHTTHWIYTRRKPVKYAQKTSVTLVGGHPVLSNKHKYSTCSWPVEGSVWHHTYTIYLLVLLGCSWGNHGKSGFHLPLGTGSRSSFSTVCPGP
jgi:hypothetical protein